MQDKKQPNIPPLRFAGFTQEWEEKKLGEIGVTYTGLSGKSKQDFGHGNATFITYLNVYVNPLANKLGVDKVEIDQSQNEVKSGDILFTTSSETPEEVGMSSVWLHDTPNTYLNSFCFGYRPSININPYFSASLFRSPGVREDFKLLAQGISRFNISKQKAMELEVSLPSLGEQEQIGEFFRALDELIGAKEEELEKLRQMKAALLESMFPNDKKQTNVNGGGYNHIDVKTLPEGLCLSEGSVDTPRLRFRGFTEPWQRKKLGELFTLRNGYTPSKDNQKYWENGSISWFRMEDIRENGHILKDAIQKVTPEAVKGAGLFPANSFILSTTATIGEHAWIIADSLANQRFTVLSTVNRWETLDIRYFHQYCFLLGEWCKRNVNVGGLNAVNIADLINHHIPFPSLSEQERIGEFFRSQDEGIVAVGNQVERLKAMKQACLERMFA